MVKEVIGQKLLLGIPQYGEIKRFTLREVGVDNPGFIIIPSSRFPVMLTQNVVLLAGSQLLDRFIVEELVFVGREEEVEVPSDAVEIEDGNQGRCPTFVCLQEHQLVSFFYVTTAVSQLELILNFHSRVW